MLWCTFSKYVCALICLCACVYSLALTHRLCIIYIYIYAFAYISFSSFLFVAVGCCTEKVWNGCVEERGGGDGCGSVTPAHKVYVTICVCKWRQAVRLEWFYQIFTISYNGWKLAQLVCFTTSIQKAIYAQLST